MLTVIGRMSGRAHTTPVGIVELAHQQWLVAPYGEVGWVRNARAARRVVLARGQERADYRIEEVSKDDAGPVLKRYIELEPITRPFFDAWTGSPIEAFAAEADRHPVFRLLPI
jgi:deazaflavin-dependent oxidoreductase (nitroreductase family)